MADESKPGNGEARVSAITITFEYDTAMVGFTVSEGTPIALAQMMVDEIARQLDAQRRLATTKEIIRQTRDQQRTDELLRGLPVGRHS